MLRHRNNLKLVGAAVAIPIVAIGGYFTWSLLDDIDLAKYYDDSFQEMYGDLANFNDYQNKAHTTYSTTTNSNGSTSYYVRNSTKKAIMLKQKKLIIV